MDTNGHQTDPTSVTRGADPRWLSFQLGLRRYAVPSAAVSEVIDPDTITAVPGAMPDLLGVRQIHNRIVPIMDGRRRLGLPELPAVPPAQVRVLLLTCGSEWVGLRVDGVGELLSSAGLTIAAQPGSAGLDDPVSGMLVGPGGTIALLDVARLCRLQQGNDGVA